MKPAIILGCHKSGLGVIRALGAEGVPVVGVYYNSNDMGFVSKYVVARRRCPHPEQDERGFLESLDDAAKQWAGSVLVPSDDATLVTTSKHKQRLERSFKVAAADWKTTRRYIEKKHTYRLAREIGVPCPRTSVPQTFSEALGFARKIGFPCLLKPSVGHRFFETFKKKMLLVEDESRFSAAYKTASESGLEMLVQEYIPGDDGQGVNYNSYFSGGEPYLEFTAKKMRLTPPRTGFPRVVVSERVPEVLDPGRRIIRALNYEGFSCTEFKRDPRDGVYKLLEVNGRQNLSCLLAVKCGVNFPYATYRHVGYGELPARNNGVREGVYWIDLEKDVTESVRSYSLERYSIADYVKPYRKAHVFSVWSARDPKPFVKRGVDFLKRISSTVLRFHLSAD